MSAADTIRTALREFVPSDRYYGPDGARVALEELEAELERLTVGRATLEDQTNRAELAEARVKALEDALRQYADPTNWGIERDEFKYPRLVWIGPGAAQRVPDGISLARAVLVLSGGSE